MMVGGGSSGGGGSGGGGDGEGEFPRRDERVLQWGLQETRDFIRIRAELERDFTVSKRNKKTLWESVSVRMKEEFGYRRTADQCKSKWKNLITRYKGKETTDQDGGRQFPFFDELHAIFTEREIQMQQMLLDFETGDVQPKKKIKRSVDQFSEYLSDFEIEDEERRNQDVTNIVSPRKRKGEKEKEQKRVDTASGQYGSGSLSIQDMLKEFLQQQERIEMMWKEAMEKHAHERQVFEQEWRHSMEKIERERLIAEQAWREREEQRRMRDESRAEKRDALLTMLWNKLIHETHHP